MKKWGRQILQGLAYLHHRDPPVVHGDLRCAGRWALRCKALFMGAGGIGSFLAYHGLVRPSLAQRP